MAARYKAMDARPEARRIRLKTGNTSICCRIKRIGGGSVFKFGQNNFMNGCSPCGCQVPEVVNVPGLQGDTGVGTNGISAVTLTTSIITLPSGAGAAGTVNVASSLGFAIGQLVFISLDSTHNGTFKITSIPSASSLAISWLQYPNDKSAGGTTIGVGASVVPAGVTYNFKGTVQVNGTTPVTITNSNIQTTSIIVFSLNTVGGTVGAIPVVKTITAGSCTVVATASDTSTYNFIII